MTHDALAWLSIGLYVLARELVAVFDPKEGDTITENTRPWLRARWWTMALGVLAWLWVGYHYFLEP